MGQTRVITAHFDNSRRFFENSIGKEFDFTQSTGPYEYLLGALSGCFYLTMLSIKHSVRWESVEITVTGEKRETVPTTLEKTILAIKAAGVTDKTEFEELAAKAAAECSIYNTISAVSQMETRIEYV